jgi:hypothetical protein
VEQAFLQRLSAETQRLVREIEEFAASEIELRAAPAPSSQELGAVRAVALIASASGATLLYRGEVDFQTPAVLHELLHLRRYWIDAVPQLVPIADPMGDKTKIANQIENTLEHLIITPQEARYGLDPYVSINETARQNWQAYPWSDITESWARRKMCLLSWLTTRVLVSDDGVRALARECLQQEGLLEEAESFADKIERSGSSKERCISTAIRFLRIPRAEAQMVYLDVKNRRLVRKPVPEH